MSDLPILTGSTSRSAPIGDRRVIRVDDDGYLEVVFGGAFGDVNIAQVGGNTVAGTGVNGMLGVAGDVADDDTASASYPVKIGAVADQVPSSVADGDMVHLITDLERYLRTVDKSYDALIDALKVAVTNTIATDHDEAPQSIADETNAAAATVNYPSDSGIEIGNRSFLSWTMRLNDITSVAFQVSNDGTVWIDASKQPVDAAQGTNGHAATHYTSAAGVNTDFACDWERCGYRYIRWQVVTPNATNAFEILLMQRAL